MFVRRSSHLHTNTFPQFVFMLSQTLITATPGGLAGNNWLLCLPLACTTEKFSPTPLFFHFIVTLSGVKCTAEFCMHARHSLATLSRFESRQLEAGLYGRRAARQQERTKLKLQQLFLPRDNLDYGLSPPPLSPTLYVCT